MQENQPDINQLFENLPHKDEDIAVEAFWFLQKHPTWTKENLSAQQFEKLRELVLDPNYYSSRNELIVLLEVIDSENSKDVISQYLLDDTIDTILGNKLTAVEALADIGDEKTLLMLEDMENSGRKLDRIFLQEIIQATNSIKRRLGYPI